MTTTNLAERTRRNGGLIVTSLIALVLLIGFVSVFAGGTAAQMAPPYENETIDRCGTINESGQYTLTTDLTAGSEAVCIAITASDVRLDLDNNDVIQNASTLGIAVINTDNVTIQGSNGIVQDFKTSNQSVGIAFSNTTNSSVSDVTVHNNTAGITVYDGSQNISIADNHITNNTVGVAVDLQSSATLDNNTFDNNDNATDIPAYTVTFNVTNETGDAIPADKNPQIGLYGDTYSVSYKGLDGSTTVRYGLDDSGTYTYIADADGKIRTGGQFVGNGTDVTVDVTLQEPDPTKFEGYAVSPDGTPMDGVNVTVHGMTESIIQTKGEDPVYLNSSKSDGDGYFDITGLDTTIDGENITHYRIDLQQWNGETLEYRSPSYMEEVDQFAFARLGVQNYTLSEAVTFNVEAVGIPEYLDENVSVLANHTTDNYAHSLEWLNDTAQWAYVTDSNNLTILDSDFTVNQTHDLPIENASGLSHDGSHFYTLNTSGFDGDTWAYALNVSGTDGITVDEKYTLTDTSPENYTRVSDIEYVNGSFYILGENLTYGLVDRYNETFDYADTVQEDIPADGDIRTHDSHWYHVYDDQIKSYNETWDTATRLQGEDFNGLSLPWNATGLASNGTHWYIGGQETGTITEIQLTDGGIKEFDYQVLDSRSDTELATNHHDNGSGVTNFSVAALADREFLFRLQKYMTPLQVNKQITEVTGHDGWNEQTRELNLTVNMTQEYRRVSGHVEHNGSRTFSNISVVYQEIDPNNLATHAGRYNMSDIYGPGAEYDPENGTFDIGIINPRNETGRYVIQMYAEDTDGQQYGAIKELTLEPDGGDVSNFNASLQPLRGTETGLDVFGPDPETMNISTNLKQFQFVDESGNPLELAYTAEVFMDYSAPFPNSTEVIWRRSSRDHSMNSDQSGFEVPVFGSDGMYVHVYAANYVPTSYSLTEDRLTSSGPVNITLREFNESGMVLDEGDTPNIETYLYRGATADRPYPTATDTVDTSYVGEEPLSVRLQNQQTKLNILGGNISFRMTDINSGVSVHYSNVDAARSGAPDAFFTSQAELRDAGDSFTSLWKFGSTGPSIYDNVILSVPYNESSGDNHTVHIPYLYDEDMTVVWNASIHDTDDIPDHYSEYVEDGDYRQYVDGTGVDCSDDNEALNQGLCYKDTEAQLLWLEIPHFSAVGLEVAGTVQADTGDGGEDTSEDGDDSTGTGGDVSTDSPVQSVVSVGSTVGTDTGTRATVTIDSYAIATPISVALTGVTADTVTIERVSCAFDMGTNQPNEMQVTASSTPPEGIPLFDEGQWTEYATVDIQGNLADRTTNGSVTFRVSPDRVPAEPSDLSAYHFQNSTWDDAELTYLGEGRYKIQSETFSTFAIVGPESGAATTATPTATPTDTETETATGTHTATQTTTPTAEGTPTQTETTVETATEPSASTSTGIPGYAIAFALLAVLGAAFFVLYRRRG